VRVRLALAVLGMVITCILPGRAASLSFRCSTLKKFYG
jgi:hypothetical protein